MLVINFSKEEKAQKEVKQKSGAIIEYCDHEVFLLRSSLSFMILMIKYSFVFWKDVIFFAMMRTLKRQELSGNITKAISHLTSIPGRSNVL